ncbi:MAG: dephospho-CoA kinase [Alphaproteobacteria bacterium]
MIVIGLTGSIGMGKSVAAAMLESMRIPVHEADDEVHKLLAPGAAGALAVGKAFPYFGYPQIYGRKTKSGARSIKRAALGKIIFADDEKRKKLEKILHPLVRGAQARFIRKHTNLGAKMVALDIPLLFETGGESLVHYIFVVSAPYNVQRRRVLARPGMDEKKFRAILERQMPDGEKRARADYVIHTGLGRAQTMKELKAALADIRKKHK